mmetsp:Transcript_15695/g.23106  ORF Transcript_15695/g.23106 Transcript_15695/m.23106 type:complete len:516 (-) Transcript_15695:814-2361(-)|eukprot:CAMPEP_0194228310 /NCGR_PEP_ID=MMETSP0156-20130528/43306_1 /TAXON_ID=33649 /ORGANISM="Thalassionema nitzschioides, Strain L26-B" /LENGTH=515 /DNA_ID=CAMNT_0038960821 /DNA_START=49 /DNA_END=1596 /DNA_ORIENTATION=-
MTSQHEVTDEADSLHAGQDTRGDDNKQFQKEKRRIELEEALLALQLKRLNLQQKRVELELRKAKLAEEGNTLSRKRTKKPQLMGSDTMESDKKNKIEADASKLVSNAFECEEDSSIPLCEKVHFEEKNNKSCQDQKDNSISSLQNPSLSSKEMKRLNGHSSLESMLTNNYTEQFLEKSTLKERGVQNNEIEDLSMLDSVLEEQHKYKQKKKLSGLLVNQSKQDSPQSGTLKTAKSLMTSRGEPRHTPERIQAKERLEKKRIVHKTEREVRPLLDNFLEEQQGAMLAENPNKINLSVGAVSPKCSEKVCKKKLTQRRISSYGTPHIPAIFDDCAASDHSDHSATTELRTGNATKKVTNSNSEAKKKRRSSSLPRLNRLEGGDLLGDIERSIQNANKKREGRPINPARSLKVVPMPQNNKCNRRRESKSPVNKAAIVGKEKSKRGQRRRGRSVEAPRRLDTLGIMRPSKQNSCRNLADIVDNFCIEGATHKYQILNKPFVVFNPALRASIKANDSTS